MERKSTAAILAFLGTLFLLVAISSAARAEGAGYYSPQIDARWGDSVEISYDAVHEDGLTFIIGYVTDGPCLTVSELGFAMRAGGLSLYDTAVSDYNGNSVLVIRLKNDDVPVTYGEVWLAAGDYACLFTVAETIAGEAL